MFRNFGFRVVEVYRFRGLGFRGSRVLGLHELLKAFVWALRLSGLLFRSLGVQIFSCGD